jgi:Putative beta-barrel porin 2
MRALRTAAALLLGALPSSAPAEAAENRRNLPRHRLGPLYVTPQLRLASGIDTNVFQSFDDPTRDNVTVLSPRLDGVLPVGRRLRITGMGAVDLFYYRRQDDERSVDFQGEGRAELTLGPLLLFGGGGGGQFTQRFSIDVDDRIKRQEERGYAGLTWQATRKLSTTFQGMAEVYKFAPGEFRLGGDIKQALDRNTLSATGQLRFALTKRTTLLASAEAIEDQFFSQPASFPPDRQSRRYLGGFEFTGRGLLTGRLLVGRRVFSGTLAEGTPPYKGPVVSADVSLPVGRRARVRVLGDRDVMYASSLVEVQILRYRNAYIYERALGEAIVDLPFALLGVGSFGFESAEYLLPLPFPDEFHLAMRVDHRWTGVVSLYRRFGETVRVGGTLLWTRRVSNLPTFSYEAWRYGLVAEIRP